MDCAAPLLELRHDLAIRLLDSAMTVTHTVHALRPRYVQALASGDAGIAADFKQALDHLAEVRRELISCADAITGTQPA